MCNNILIEADYILATNVTIRVAAQHFGISKSVLHRHMNKLKDIDVDRYLKIKKIFLEHNNVRHINGGIATKKKYLQWVILLIIYIVEDTLYCAYRGKLISAFLKSCIQKGFIINKDVFMHEFSAMLKKEKIRNKLFGDNITFVDNGYFSVGDLFFIENIFLDMGFIKVDFLNIRELLPEAKATFVEINNSYLVLYLDKTLYLDLSYFNDIPKVLGLFISYFDNDIALFGVNKCIPKVYINNVNIYYIENYKDYITQSLLKVKKQAVLLPFFY